MTKEAIQILTEIAPLRRVIVESPCAASASRTVDDNANYLAACLRDSLNRGEAPIASHGLFAFSGVLDETNPEEREQGMKAGWAWLQAADAVVLYLDHGLSQGMAMAELLATTVGTTVERRYLLRDTRPGPSKMGEAEEI